MQQWSYESDRYFSTLSTSSIGLILSIIQSIIAFSLLIVGIIDLSVSIMLMFTGNLLILVTSSLTVTVNIITTSFGWIKKICPIYHLDAIFGLIISFIVFFFIFAIAPAIPCLYQNVRRE